MALLSGARNQQHSQLGEELVHRMKKLFPDLKSQLASALILLSNIHGSLGDQEKASDIRQELSEFGVKKVAGRSWTVIDGKISVSLLFFFVIIEINVFVLQSFRAHERSHPRSSEIHGEVMKMMDEVMKHGYQADSSWVTRPLVADETIDGILCGHSERLALAWNFLVNPNTRFIQITKNLRVCGDCRKCQEVSRHRCSILFVLLRSIYKIDCTDSTL